MEDKIRAFIAIELSSDMKHSLAQLIERLKSADLRGIRWVNPESIHLTLKFLGDIPQSQVDEIVAVITSCANQSHPFALSLGELGSFPKLDAPRVLLVGLNGDIDELTPLQQGIEDGLQNLGFQREKRPFSPHLTLARMRDRATLRDRKQVGLAFAEAQGPEEASMEVRSLSLMKSTLTPSGAVYTRLASAAL